MNRTRNALILAGLATLAAATAVWNGQAAPAPSRSTPDTAAVQPDTTMPHRVVVYYLHSTARCVSCRKIEAYTREAIQDGFADELGRGVLVWRTINFDEKANRHFVKDYKLFTKSVIVIDERLGRQKSWKNLARIWELLGDKPAFVAYVQNEIRTCLSAS